MEYYSIPSSGLCAVKDQFTPSWITEFFTDYAACCKKGWVESKCLAEAPPGAIDADTKSQQYLYIVPTTGLCSPVDDHTPGYMTIDDYFTSYWACCEKSWDKTACVEAKPPGEPTASPSLRPSDSPSASSSPSFHPSYSEKPSPVPTDQPSFSLGPTIEQSSSPSSSLTPTFMPSSSTKPSSGPSYQPSSSAKPSSGPSYLPSSSLEPMLSSENTTTSAADDGNGTSTTTSTSSSTPANNSTVCESGLWHVSDDFSKCTNR